MDDWSTSQKYEKEFWNQTGKHWLISISMCVYVYGAQTVKCLMQPSRKHRIVQTTHVAEMDPPKDLYLHHFSKDRLRWIVTTPYAILFGHWCSQIFQESLSLQDRKESRQFQLKWYMKILWRFCVSYVEPQIFTYISRVTLSLLSLKKGTEKIMQDRGKQI